MAARVYRTRDGRHVLEDDPDAAFLAFSQYDDVPPAVLVEVGLKKGDKAADKQAAKPADKSRTRRGRAKPATDLDIHNSILGHKSKAG